MDVPTQSRWKTKTWPALAIALALALPTLWVGRVGEDTYQLLATEGVSSPFLGGFRRFDAFVFANGQADQLAAVRQAGSMPYWTRLDFKVAFWRPLSSALMVVDRALFGRSAPLAHAHSVLWSLALVAVVGALFRKLFSAPLAAFALLLFSLDDARAIPTAWLANRNALVAATFAVLAVAGHLLWRERGDRKALFGSLAAALVALHGGEAALGFFAYLLAYELLAGPGPISRRLAALVPITLVVAAWLAAYKLHGYGAANSTMYVDPFVQPLDWLMNLPARLAVTGGAALIGFPADLWMSPGLRIPLAIAAALLVTGLAFLLRAAARELPPDESRHLRWLFAGALISLLPVTSTSPSNRLLLAGSLGAAACLAVVLRQAWRLKGKFLPVALGLGFFHLVLPPLLWLAFSFAFSMGNARAERIQRTLEAELDQTKVANQRLVALWNDPFGTMATAANWIASGAPAPRALWTLSLAPAEHRYTRTGPSTLELDLAAESRLLTSEVEFFCRPPGSTPFESVELDGLSVQVIDRDKAGIRKVRFEFDRELEDPSLVFLGWKDGAMHVVAPPPMGDSLYASPAQPF